MKKSQKVIKKKNSSKINTYLRSSLSPSTSTRQNTNKTSRVRDMLYSPQPNSKTHKFLNTLLSSTESLELGNLVLRTPRIEKERHILFQNNEVVEKPRAWSPPPVKKLKPLQNQDFNQKMDQISKNLSKRYGLKKKATVCEKEDFSSNKTKFDQALNNMIRKGNVASQKIGYENANNFFSVKVMS
mmetsp:Transcript_5192/g.4377  ORF Transcript_5192/g.4377 Transcript_5192/m.4377 type:complete len:185 (+) Transcript_5192:465-1019(+)